MLPDLLSVDSRFCFHSEHFQCPFQISAPTRSILLWSVEKCLKSVPNPASLGLSRASNIPAKISKLKEVTASLILSRFCEMNTANKNVLNSLWQTHSVLPDHIRQSLPGSVCQAIFEWNIMMIWYTDDVPCVEVLQHLSIHHETIFKYAWWLNLYCKPGTYCLGMLNGIQLKPFFLQRNCYNANITLSALVTSYLVLLKLGNYVPLFQGTGFKTTIFCW